MRERSTLFGVMAATVDAELCNGCSLCRKVCTEGAVNMEGGIAVVSKDKCRACNLCVLKCPKRALSLTGAAELEALISSYKCSPAAGSFRSFMEKDRVTLADTLSLPKKLREWKLR